MVKRALFTLILSVILCGSAFAADESPAAREEISLESARKERMAPISAQADGGAARAKIDVNDSGLPRPAPVEKAEPKIVTEPLVESPVMESNAPAPIEEKPVIVVTPLAAEVKPVTQKKPFADIKFRMPWQGKPKVKKEPKREPTKEEELDKKIQAPRFGGETGFTTVNTYRNKGIKKSDAEAKQALAESGLVTLDLNDCIKIAEANHIQAIVARKSIKLAEMRLFEARRNMLPSATIVVERSKGRVSDADYLGRKQYIEGQQPIYHGGELYFTMKQAEVNLQIAKNDHQRVKNDLVLQVKKAYYTLEKATENAILQHALSKEVEKICSIASKGYEAGVVARVEYLNVNSQTSRQSTSSPQLMAMSQSPN